MSLTRFPGCRRSTSSAPVRSWIPPACVPALRNITTSISKNVHAYVFGEHGDSSFVPWSLGNISNIPIDRYAESLTNADILEPELVHSEVETYIRKSGGKIIERKGATFYAVAVSVCHICKCIFSGAGHRHDRVHHDARRIRGHGRRMPEHADHRGCGRHLRARLSRR